MGWTKQNGLWGDEPQDIVSDAIEKKLGKGYYKVAEVTPRIKKMQIATILLRDKALRQKVNKVYIKYRKKPMTENEYKNLIRKGLFLE